MVGVYSIHSKWPIAPIDGTQWSFLLVDSTSWTWMIDPSWANQIRSSRNLNYLFLNRGTEWLRVSGTDNVLSVHCGDSCGSPGSVHSLSCLIISSMKWDNSTLCNMFVCLLILAYLCTLLETKASLNCFLGFLTLSLASSFWNTRLILFLFLNYFRDTPLPLI